MVREGNLHKSTPLSVVETSVVMPCCHLYVLCFQALQSDSENYSIKLKGGEKKQKIKKSLQTHTVIVKAFAGKLISGDKNNNKNCGKIMYTRSFTVFIDKHFS